MINEFGPAFMINSSRKRRLWWKINKTNIAIISVWISGLLMGWVLFHCRPAPEVIKTTVPQIKYSISPTLTPEPTKIPKASQKTVTGNTLSWVGKVSYYSRAGCIGCSNDLKTASGEILSDTDLTIAFNHLPMGTKVKVTNTRNNQSVIARINDTGGFYRYGRIADLNLATKNVIDAKTDTDVIIIEAL